MSDEPSHKDVRAEARTAERSNGFESLPLEHGIGAIGGLIPEGARFPTRDRVSLDDSAALLLDGGENSFQSCGRYTPPAVSLVDDEAGDTPEAGLGRGFLECGLRLRGFLLLTRKSAVLPAVINAGQLVAESVLTPADGLILRVHEDAVGATDVDKTLLLPAISDRAFYTGVEMLLFCERARPLKMDAPAMVPAVALRKEVREVGPGFWRELSGGE